MTHKATKHNLHTRKISDLPRSVYTNRKEKSTNQKQRVSLKHLIKNIKKHLGLIYKDRAQQQTKKITAAKSNYRNQSYPESKPA